MLKRILFFVLMFLCSRFTTAAQADVAEADLKAVFIYNFTKYIEWDLSVPDEFVIGVMGPSSIYSSLSEIAKSKTVNGKKIVVRRFDTPEEATYCNIIFISRNVPLPLAVILAQVGKGTLTISEEPGFAEKGTALNFVVVNDKLKFEANVKSLQSAGLKASSQLLKLAIIVN